MEKPITVLTNALGKFNTENLSQLLFDNKSEIACNQRLCVAINQDSKDYQARVEYNDKSQDISRADLVLIEKETGDVSLCIEAKMLAVFNIISPTQGEKKKGNSHKYFHDLKVSIDKHGSNTSKLTLMWIFGWDKLKSKPKEHLKEKYFSDRFRKGMSLSVSKAEICKKIRDSFFEARLGKPITQQILVAKDQHFGNKAFLIATLGKYNLSSLNKKKTTKKVLSEGKRMTILDKIVKAAMSFGFELKSTTQTVKPVHPPNPFGKQMFIEINYSGRKFGFSFHPNRAHLTNIKLAQRTLLELGYRPEKHTKSGYTLVMSAHNKNTPLKIAKAFKELVDKAGEVFGRK